MNQNSLNKFDSVIKIKNFNLHSCMKGQVWRSIIPTIAIMALLYFTLCSGILYSQKERLEINESQMELDILQRDLTHDYLIMSASARDSLKTVIEKRILDNSTQRQSLLQKE